MQTIESTKEFLSIHRLVRDLNAHGRVNGFYANYNDGATRCNRARSKGNVLEVYSFNTGWFKPTNLLFSDVYGQMI